MDDDHGWLYLLSWKQPCANIELETGRDDDSAATRHGGEVYLLARRLVFLSPPNKTLRFLSRPRIRWTA